MAIFKKKLSVAAKRLFSLRYTPLAIILCIIALIIPVLFVFSVQTATLGSGVTIATGTHINLTGTNTNMTLLGDVIVDNITVASNYALLIGTISPPSFITGSSYQYVPSLHWSNLTGVTGTQQDLNVSTTSLTLNSLIRGTTGALKNVSLPSAISLKIGSLVSGTITIYSIYEPSGVINNSITYPQGAMWNYNSTSHIISITGTTYLATVVWNNSRAMTFYYTGLYSWYNNAPLAFPDVTYVDGGVTKTLTMKNTPQTVLADINSPWSVQTPFFGGNEFWTPNATSGTVINDATVVISYTHGDPCSEPSALGNAEQGCVGSSTASIFGESIGIDWLFVLIGVIIFVAIFAKSNNILLAAIIFVMWIAITIGIFPQSIIRLVIIAIVVSAAAVIVRLLRRPGS